MSNSLEKVAAINFNYSQFPSQLPQSNTEKGKWEHVLKILNNKKSPDIFVVGGFDYNFFDGFKDVFFQKFSKINYTAICTQKLANPSECYAIIYKNSKFKHISGSGCHSKYFSFVKIQLDNLSGKIFNLIFWNRLNDPNKLKNQAAHFALNSESNTYIVAPQFGKSIENKLNNHIDGFKLTKKSDFECSYWIWTNNTKNGCLSKLCASIAAFFKKLFRFL